VINLPRLALGLLLSTVIGYAAYRRGSLTRSGWLGAVITGTLTFGFGGWAWGLTLITFFVTSSGLSKYKEQLKARRFGQTFAKGGRRDLAQTLANGGLGALLALLYGLTGEPPALAALFLGVMAAVNADTWATELGVLSPHQPRLITSGRRVATGTSGGVTLIGTLAAAGGGLVIGLALMLFSAAELRLLAGQAAPFPFWMPLAGLLAGLLGALADSLLGATVQVLYRDAAGAATERAVGRDGAPHAYLRGWRWMNNDAVNLLASLVGGVVALLVLLAATVV
jgi:uncharacterized protein (TIGR00297 family)